MTRYETYANLFVALFTEAQNDPSNDDLFIFVDSMNPYSRFDEGSRDPEVYFRFCEKWDEMSESVDPGISNDGLTFSAVFLNTYPQIKKKLPGVLEAFNKIDNETWSNYVISASALASYCLLYYLLKPLAADDSALADFLKDSDPFSEQFSYSPSKFVDDYMRFWILKGYKEIFYSNVTEFVNNCEYDVLKNSFKKIKEKDWDDVRFNKPYVFRMLADE